MTFCGLFIIPSSPFAVDPFCFLGGRRKGNDSISLVNGLSVIGGSDWCVWLLSDKYQLIPVGRWCVTMQLLCFCKYRHQNFRTGVSSELRYMLSKYKIIVYTRLPSMVVSYAGALPITSHLLSPDRAHDGDRASTHHDDHPGRAVSPNTIRWARCRRRLWEKLMVE